MYECFINIKFKTTDFIVLNSISCFEMTVHTKYPCLYRYRVEKNYDRFIHKRMAIKNKTIDSLI